MKTITQADYIAALAALGINAHTAYGINMNGGSIMVNRIIVNGDGAAPLDMGQPTFVTDQYQIVADEATSSEQD